MCLLTDALLGCVWFPIPSRKKLLQRAPVPEPLLTAQDLLRPSSEAHLACRLFGRDAQPCNSPPAPSGMPASYFEGLEPELHPCLTGSIRLLSNRGSALIYLMKAVSNGMSTSLRHRRSVRSAEALSIKPPWYQLAYGAYHRPHGPSDYLGVH